MDWQPIETAPRDGARVLLKTGEHPEGVVGWWSGDLSECGEGYCGWTDGTDIDWPEDANASGPLEMHPTHWSALNNEKDMERNER